MDYISWKEFEKVDLHVGTIIEVTEFPEARKPAWKVKIDLGPMIGEKKSSAQITAHYSKADLIGKQVLCVTNFAPKQIGNFMSEVLITGVPDTEGEVVLLAPDKNIPNGSKLF